MHFLRKHARVSNVVFPLRGEKSKTEIGEKHLLIDCLKNTMLTFINHYFECRAT